MCTYYMPFKTAKDMRFDNGGNCRWHLQWLDNLLLHATERYTCPAYMVAGKPTRKFVGIQILFPKTTRKHAKGFP